MLVAPQDAAVVYLLAVAATHPPDLTNQYFNVQMTGT
jgi:hypothetical protein